MPMFTKVSERPRIRPRITTQMPTLEPKLATGTRAVLIWSGTYPLSCCMTWPHSWAATPMAATEVLP